MEHMLHNDATKIKFETVKTFVYNSLLAKQLDIKAAEEAFNKSSNEEIVKAAFDYTFRIYVMENMDRLTIAEIRQTLDMAVQAVQKKLCFVTTPIFMINDLLSSLTIEKCLEVFCYLEDNSHIWRSVPLTSALTKQHMVSD